MNRMIQFGFKFEDEKYAIEWKDKIIAALIDTPGFNKDKDSMIRFLVHRDDPRIMVITVGNPANAEVGREDVSIEFATANNTPIIRQELPVTDDSGKPVKLSEEEVPQEETGDVVDISEDTKTNDTVLVDEDGTQIVELSGDMEIVPEVPEGPADASNNNNLNDELSILALEHKTLVPGTDEFPQNLSDIGEQIFKTYLEEYATKKEITRNEFIQKMFAAVNAINYFSTDEKLKIKIYLKQKLNAADQYRTHKLAELETQEEKPMEKAAKLSDDDMSNLAKCATRVVYEEIVKNAHIITTNNSDSLYDDIVGSINSRIEMFGAAYTRTGYLKGYALKLVDMLYCEADKIDETMNVAKPDNKNARLAGIEKATEIFLQKADSEGIKSVNFGPGYADVGINYLAVNALNGPFPGSIWGKQPNFFKDNV